jgi:hypothetical protein
MLWLFIDNFISIIYVTQKKELDLLHAADIWLIILIFTLIWNVKRDTGWQTFKRPGVDAFLEHLAQFYEIVVYTDEQNMVIWFSFSIFWTDQYHCYDIWVFICSCFCWFVQFVDPVIERLDPKHCIRYRLSRPATKYQDGKHYRVRLNLYSCIILSQIMYIHVVSVRPIVLIIEKNLCALDWKYYS